MPLLVIPAAVPAQAAGTPDITVTKSAPAGVLAGSSVPFTMTASNPNGNPPGFNLMFRDVLPAGVSYVPGSTTPSDLDDPTVYADQPAPGLTTLVWSNVADVQPGGSFTLGFSAALSAATYPVNTTLTNTGEGYVNSNARTVPRVNSSGAPVAASFTGSGISAPTVTTVSAVSVSKSMPSPENELVRGVHGGFPQVWTLTVTNNKANATTGTTVTDYVPARLEFLGCGGVDNSPAGTTEYPGSGRLTNVPVITTNCPTPTSVDTVQNPPGLAAGVYTKVVWDLGTLAPNDVATIRYKAGAPLQANVFPGPAGPDTANLANNTGASSSETGTELTATNTAVVAGTYTGPVKPGTSSSVTARDSLTVTLEDFALDKTPDGAFKQGTIVTWSLRVRAGEYRDLTNVQLVDTLPSGLCPLGPANYAQGSPAECDPVPGQGPSIPYASAPSVNGDGTTTVPFDVGNVAAGATTTVTFPARARATYTGGTPTVAGDSFVNKVTGSATSVPTAGSPDPAPLVTVADDSSATLSTSGPTIEKLVSAAVAPPGTMSCASATYVDPTASPDTRPEYAKGDRVCFKLKMTFPGSVQTRNPVVADLLPPGLNYEPASQAPTANNTVAISFNEAAAAAGSANPTWILGTGSPNTFVPLSAVFEATFSAIVDSDASAGRLFDVQGNVMKVRAESTSGVAFSLRDRVDLKVVAGPRLSLLKGVAGVASPYNNPPNVDDVRVRAGSTVRYRIDITNNGATSAQSTQVRDVLPAGITCGDVTDISDAGTCQPSSGGISTSVIVWDLAATDVIAVGSSRAPLTYDVTIPTGVSVDQDYINTAGVLSYESPTNLDGTVQYVPMSNIDPSVTPTAGTPPAKDTSRVYTNPVSLVKSHTTSLIEAGNSGPQATIGETITYSVVVTVPAQLTAYDAAIVDPIPAGQSYVVGSATATLDGAALPPGFILTGGPTEVRLTPPSVYNNSALLPAVFEIRFQTVVLDDPINVRGATPTNTVTATSNYTPGGAAVPPQTASDSVPVVEPQLRVTKSNTAPGGIVVAGQEFTYTVRVQNVSGSGVSIAHETSVSDVVPAGLSYVAGSVSNGGTYDSATRTVSWTIGDVAVGGSLNRTFKVTVDPGALSGATYTNTAVGTTTSMPGVVPGERTYTSNGPNTVTVQKATTTKSVSPGTATIGDLVTFTVTSTVPNDVRLYDATLVDTLPTGLTYVSTVSTTCSASPCPATVPADSRQNGQRLGWYFGDPAISAAPYSLTAVYTARVANIPSNVNGIARTNTAALRWGTVDKAFPATGLPANSFWDKAGNNASAIVTVIEPALAVTKTVDSPTLAPGDTRTYTLTLRNTGTAPAFAATVNDPIPNLLVVDGTSFIGPGTATLTGAGANGGGTVAWSVPGPIPAGGAVTLTYTAELAASAQVPTGQSLSNTATLTGYAGLPGGPGAYGRPYTGNASTATVTSAFPRVVVAKTTASGAETGTATIGASFGWRVVLTNTSTVSAREVSITDALPANWTYDTNSATLTPQGGATAAAEPTITGQVLTWATTFTVPAGQTLTLRFTATPQVAVTTDPGVGPTNPHINSANATVQDATGATGNASGEYVTGPDTATAYVDSADLQIDKSHTGSFTAGSNGTFTIKVTNAGPSAAGGPLTVTDTLPTGLTFVSGGSANGWAACSAVGQTVTCSRAAGLAAGASASFPLVVAVAADLVPGSLTNTASVTGPTYDPVPGNNTDTDPTTIATSADLAVVKAVSGPVVAGRDVTWTLDVTNSGPSVSRGPIVLTDDLPEGTTYVSADGGPDWSCSEASGTVTCTHADDLDPLASAPRITFIVALSPTATGSLTNVGKVDGPTSDPVPGNNTSTVTVPIATSADLVLTKSHTGSFLAGGQGSYVMDVVNLGPSSAAGPLTLTDSLPTGLSLAGDGGQDGWSCSAAGQDVTCTRASGLVKNASTSFTLLVDVASNVTTSLDNEATVSSPTTDPLPLNNTDTDSTGVTAEANLNVTKTHPGGPVVAGDQVSYTVVISNAGRSDAAPDVTLEDTLPSGFSLADVTAPAAWDCPFAVGDTVLSCTRGTPLASGASTTLTVVVDVDPSQPVGSYDNAVTVSSSTPDPDESDNTATDPTTVTTSADLSLEKTADDTSVPAGTSTSFTLKVANAGLSDADGPITVSDTLPVGTAFVSGGSGNGWSACTVAGQVVTCQRAAALAAGATAGDLVITVDVSSSTPAGTLTNRAAVSSPTPDPAPGNNTDTATVDITVAADLTLAKSHRESPVLAGGMITFDLQVSNAGPSDAVAPLIVTDTLPAKIRYVSTSAPWSCTAGGDPLVGQSVECTLAAGLAGGSAASPVDAPLLTIVTTVDSDLSPGVVTNAATVEAPNSPDPDTSNDTDTDDVAVEASADLSVVKVSTTPLIVGSEATYSLTITNAGLSTANDLVLSDPMPAGLTLVSATGAGWDCTTSTATDLNCTRPTLSVGPASVVTLVVDVGAAGYPEVANTATIDAATTDPDPGNDTSTDVSPVPARVDLAMDKSHTAPVVSVGDRFVYTLAVSNLGPTDDPAEIKVTDELPPGLTYVSATGDGWTCAANGQAVTCIRAGLAIGDAPAIRVVVDVGPEAAPSVTNTATVSSPSTDVDPTNNSDLDPTDVRAVADLAITKTVVGPVVTGQSVRYDLVVSNRGPSAEEGPIVVTDRVPDGLTSATANGPGWTCDTAAATVSCTRPGPLAAGASAPTITLRATVSAPAGSTIRNAASVSGTTFDRDPANNADVAAAEVISPGDLPHTGADISRAVSYALFLIGLGLALVFVSSGRRRRV